METVETEICLFTPRANKKGPELKNTIELTDLEKISLQPTIKVEKHKYDKYICIEVHSGYTSFLRFDSK